MSALDGHEDFVRRRQALVAQFAGVLTDHERALVEEMFTANEPEMALHWLATMVVERGKQISRAAYESLVVMAMEIGFGDEIPPELINHVEDE